MAIRSGTEPSAAPLISTAVLLPGALSDRKRRPGEPKPVAKVESFADVNTGRKRPAVRRVGRPVEGHWRIGINVPSTLEVVADLRLDIGLIVAPARARPRDRHQLIGQYSTEPGAL